MAAEILAELQTLVQDDLPPFEATRDKLAQFTNAVKAGGPAVREEVNALNAYQVVIRSWAVFCSTSVSTAKAWGPDAEVIRNETLKALYSLTSGFPDIIDENGWIMVEQAMDNRLPEETQILAFKDLRNVCIKSEQNREHFTWELNQMEPLVQMIKRDKPSGEFVREWCGAIKTLILSDDNRVAYNRAPERKRMICQQNVLPLLARHLHAYEGDEMTQNSIVIVLGSMAVNEDMCISIESGNVLPSIVKIFKSSSASAESEIKAGTTTIVYPCGSKEGENCAGSPNKMLIKNTLSLLRYLNVSQTIRDKCASYGLVKWVLQIMLQHKSSPDVLEVSLSCLAFMTLRNACQAAQFLTADGVEITLELVKQNLENIQMLKGMSLTLRNVAASGGTNAQMKILKADGEQLLRQAQERFPDLTENHVKPALRDLGVLKEEEESRIAKASLDPLAVAILGSSSSGETDRKSNPSNLSQ